MSVKKNKYKLSEESALAQVEAFLDHYDFDLDEMPDEQRKVAQTCVNKLVSAVRKGRLEFSGGPVVKQFLKSSVDNSDAIEYSELSGVHKSAMKGDGDYQKIYGLLGALTSLGSGIMKLKGADLSVAESLGFIFLQI